MTTSKLSLLLPLTATHWRWLGNLWFSARTSASKWTKSWDFYSAAQ